MGGDDVITAHRPLGDAIGTYRPGWVLLDDDGTTVATVRTKREAQAIVTSQQLPPPKETK